MAHFCLAALFALTVLTYAAHTTGTEYLVKETINVPGGWVKHSKPSPGHIISLRIGLPQSNFPILERLLYEVSDPDHVRYGQHLSKVEVEELVAPHPSSLNAVNDWLATYGLGDDDISRSPAKDWIKIDIPVSLAEEMLDTEYHVYQHETDGDYLVRTSSYSLPKHLHEHVDIVQPTTMFGRFKPQKTNVIYLGEDTDEQPVSQYQTANEAGFVDPTCNTTITIKCLQQIYNAVGYTPRAKGNSIGVTGYLEQYANLDDLQLFYADQRPDALKSSFKFISIKGGINSQNKSKAGIEANLDVQFAFGLTHPIPATFYSTAGRPPYHPDTLTPTNTNEPYADWLDFVLAHDDVPSVISTSYGDDEQTVPKSYALRVCAGFAQLGARGVSLMFGSGDNGVGDGNMNPKTDKCFTNDGKHTKEFFSFFPAACPFVTAVGGTQHYPEISVSRFFSGGGFSNYFDQPNYQKVAAETYLDALPKGLYKGLYNPRGRATAGWDPVTGLGTPNFGLLKNLVTAC
ncbi:hypothetical protein APHAL10511_004085 [Amanita phalloides]|nr:hypothetical protein APHAL10511_004085 [Amanita phalloides]